MIKPKTSKSKPEVWRKGFKKDLQISSKTSVIKERLAENIGKKVYLILLPFKPNTIEIVISGKLKEENWSKLGTIYEVNQNTLNYVSFSIKNIKSITYSKENIASIHLKL